MEKAGEARVHHKARVPRAAAVVAPANRAAGRSRKRRASHDGRLLHQHQRKRARLEDTPDGSLGTFFDELSAVNPALASEVDSALGKYGLEAKSKWELSERNKRDRQDRLDNVRLDDRLEREKARWVAAMDGGRSARWERTTRQSSPSFRAS